MIDSRCVTLQYTLFYILDIRKLNKKKIKKKID